MGCAETVWTKDTTTSTNTSLPKASSGCRRRAVRVTFDRNIRSSSEVARFFDAGCSFRPVLPAGTNMMEVKFDELLPDFISASLQTGLLSHTSFSKYYLCRKYSLRGNYDF